MTKFRLFVGGAVMAAVGLCLAGAQDHGVEVAAPIGPYLDGAFPSAAPGPTGSWILEDAFPNVSFVDPVRVVPDPTNAEQVYVVCRNGEIWKLPDDPSAQPSDRLRFLDRRDVTWGHHDAGMMSLTFHPEFGQPDSPNRGYCYVFYQYTLTPSSTSNSAPSYMRLSRFTVPDGSEQVDSDSEFVLIQQYDRHNWHNGGQTFFGADGFLYVVIGDEGAANDSYNVAQKIDDRLFSGILRIDVDQDDSRSHPIRRQPQTISRPDGWPASFSQGYSIPNDNPWLDVDGGILEEFWTIGLRSPHSMHYDAATGNIWIAEVGQSAREEVTVARRGGNHQWPYREGSIAGARSRPSTVIGTEVPPIHDYPRTDGGCVIGGMVYRGSEHAGSLTGKYIFGDHNTRSLWALTPVAGQAPEIEYLTSVFRSGGRKRGLSGISPNAQGECYVCELGDTGTNTGKVYRLARSGETVPEPPEQLSQTGAFTDLETLTPREGLLPYDVNAPLWSDNARKQRWIAIPNDGTHDSPGEQIGFSEAGNWEFPVGTVIVKHFELPIDERDPAMTRRLEIRFLVKGEDERFFGVTYRWREDGSDADLLTSGLVEDIAITQENGSRRQQEWLYPSRAECFTCHTDQAGQVLGLRTHQLHREQFFPGTGRTDNILRAWNHIGLFSPDLNENEIEAFERSAGIDDLSRPLVDRVRSWLDSNCAHCHQPGGVLADFDVRFHTPLEAQGLIGGTLRGSYNVSNPAVVVPGDPFRSVLYLRDNSLGDDAMPPLAKNLVHREAMEVMAEWIEGLDAGQAAPLLGQYFVGQNFDSLALTRSETAIDFNWGSGSPASEVPSNDFSVRWSGTVVPAFSESYTFYTETDDGVRLWVNDQLIINRWRDQAATEWSGALSLTAGVPASIRMEYYENGGNASARLSWSSDRTSKAVIPASAFAAGGGEAPSVSLAAASPTVDGPFEVTFTFSKPVSGLVAADIEVSNGEVAGLSGQGDAYLALVTPASFGEVSVRLPQNAAFDANGRGNGASNVLALNWLDEVAPTLTLATGSASVTEAFEVTATFSESVAGFESTDIEVSNGEVVSFSGAGEVYAFSVAPTAEGAVVVQVPGAVAEDENGNPNEASESLNVSFVAPTEQVLRVYLLAGQSNMSGNTDRLDLPDELNVPQEDVDFYYRVSGGQDVFTVLQAGSSDGGDFGPELTFGRFMADFYGETDPNVRVALIKYARGGSALYAGWEPGGGESETFHEVVSNGLAQLATAYPEARIEIAGMLWQQGEADALSGQAFGYADNLTAFIQNNRQRYGADLPFVFGRLSAGQTEAIGASEMAALREAQEAVDGLDTRVKMIDTDGMEVQSDDVIHFSSFGIQDLGIALAEGLLSVEGVTLPATSVNLSTLSSTVFGGFAVDLLADRPLSGISLDDIVVTNGVALGVEGISRERVITVEPTAHGEVTVQLPAGSSTDPLGLPVEASNLLTVTYGDQVSTDALDAVVLPDVVRRGETAEVSIAYRAMGPRDLQVLLHDAQEGWRLDVDYFTQVDAGTGTLALELPVEPGARLGDGYLWAVRLIPAGSDFSAAVDEYYQSATMEEASGGVLFDRIEALRVPVEVERGETVLVEMDYRAEGTRDIELLLQDSQNNWQTVASAPSQVEAGVGTLSFNVTIAPEARVGDGYVWVNRMLPAGGSNTEAVDETYASGTVLPSSQGGGLDLINAFTAPSTVYRAQAAQVRIDFEAAETRDLNVVLLDSLDGWRVVGAARADVAPGIGSQEFTLGIASDGRVGEGYVWVAQLLPQGATDGALLLDERYVSAAMGESEGLGELVNYAVLPESTATQSSVYGSAFVADLARDGNTDGDWRNGSVTHTELDDQAWWEVDLGVARSIEHLFVWNRTDCCAERLTGFYVLVSDDPFVSQDLEASIGQEGVFSAFVSGTPEPTARVEVGRTGRFVRIQLSEQGYLGLAEVEIFGRTGGGVVNGLTYQYYEGTWESLPSFSGLPARKTGTVSNVSLTPRLREDFFAFRYRGCLIVPSDGTYTFFTNSDAGSQLSIDGALVVDNDGEHALLERSGTVELTAGMHPIELRYFETDGEEALEMSWEGPGFTKQPIPSSALSVNESRVSPTFRYALPQLRAGDNTDGDVFDLAAEFALGQNPFDGNVEGQGLHLTLTPEGVNVHYDRPPGLTEFRYVLQASSDLATWFDILGAELQEGPDGAERVLYRRLHERSPLSRERGFVRLRIEHVPWNHVTYLPVWGWQETEFFPGHQTFGAAFASPVIYGGRVADVEGARLTAVAGGLRDLWKEGRSYFLEVTSGVEEGHRFEIDTAFSEEQKLRVELTGVASTRDALQESDLMDASFVIREHQALADLFPKERFVGSNDPGSADQVLFYKGGRYQAYHLLDAGGRYHWARSSDAALTSEDDRVVPSGEGCFVWIRPREATVKVSAVGQVRDHAFVQPLQKGFNLLAPPVPVWSTPVERGLAEAAGFTAAFDPSESDQVLRWNVQTQSFEGIFLLQDSQMPYWTGITDAQLEDLNDVKWFAQDGAAFLFLLEEPAFLYRVENPLAP